MEGGEGSAEFMGGGVGDNMREGVDHELTGLSRMGEHIGKNRLD